MDMISDLENKICPTAGISCNMHQIMLCSIHICMYVCM